MSIVLMLTVRMMSIVLVLTVRLMLILLVLTEYDVNSVDVD